MKKEDSTPVVIIKGILIAIIIGLVIFLIFRNKKIEFDLLEHIPVNGIDLYLESMQVTDELQPTNAAEGYRYYESLRPDDTIIDFIGTFKNTSEEAIVLKEEINTYILINNERFNINMLYETTDGKEFVDQGEQRKEQIEPGTETKIHFVAVLNKNKVKKNDIVKFIVENEPKDYMYKTQFN